MNKRTRRSSSVLLILFALAAGAVIVGIAILVGNRNSFSARTAVQSIRRMSHEKTKTTEFTYSNAGDAAFASMGGGFVIADTSGVRFVESDGTETRLSDGALIAPAAVSNGTEALIYDSKGTFLLLADSAGVIWQGDAEGTVFGAALNSAGWCTILSECAGYNGAVTVYNGRGRAVYRWYSGEGYVISADLADNCRSLAVLTVEESGSRLGLFLLSSTEEQARLEFPGEIALKVDHVRPDAIQLLLPDRICTVSTEGVITSETAWTDRILTATCFDGDDFSVAAWLNYQVGSHGGLVSVSGSGTVLGRIDTYSPVIEIDAAGNYIVVRAQDGYTLYDKNLNILFETQGMTETIAVMAHTDGSFIAAGEYAAEIYGK